MDLARRGGRSAGPAPHDTPKLDERLAPLVERFPGLKPPVMPTVFETLVSAVACLGNSACCATEKSSTQRNGVIAVITDSDVVLVIGGAGMLAETEGPPADVPRYEASTRSRIP